MRASRRQGKGLEQHQLRFRGSALSAESPAERRIVASEGTPDAVMDLQPRPRLQELLGLDAELLLQGIHSGLHQFQFSLDACLVCCDRQRAFILS